jgi:hypothetical protein
MAFAHSIFLCRAHPSRDQGLRLRQAVAAWPMRALALIMAAILLICAMIFLADAVALGE